CSFDPSETWLSRRALVSLAGVISALAFVSALIAVERERRGEWLGWLERFYQSILDRLPWRRKPFASLQQAQFWLEWHRRAWLLACTLGILMAFALVLLP